MKNYIILLLSLISIEIYAQDSTAYAKLKNKQKLKLNVGFGFENFSVNGAPIFWSTSSLGLIIRKKISLDAFTSSDMSPYDRVILDPKTYDVNSKIDFFQSGLRLGYIYNYHKAVHVNAGLKSGFLFISSFDINDVLSSNKNTYFFQPECNAEFNLTRYVRLNLGVGYRIANKRDIFFQQNKASGFEYHLDFRLGKFYK
jgi:hypothetical protein